VRVREWLTKTYFKTEVLRSRLLSLSLLLVATLSGIALTILGSNYLGMQGGSVSGEMVRNYPVSPVRIGSNSTCLDRTWICATSEKVRPFYGRTCMANCYNSVESGQSNKYHANLGYANRKWPTRRFAQRIDMAKEVVPKAVLSQTKNQRLRESMLLGSALEGGWSSPFPVGDQGTSFGPYQMHEGGALTEFGLSPSQAENAKIATKYMLPVYAQAVNQISDKEWQNNPQQAAEQSAVIAESPAQDYYTTFGSGTVNAKWSDVNRVLQGRKSTGGMPSQQATLTSTSGNSGGVTGNIASGLNIFHALWDFLSGNPVAAAGDALAVGGIKDIFERIGLVLFGAMLILVGIVIFALPAAKSVGKTAIQARTAGRAFGAGSAAREADIARRQSIADRSIAIGEKKVAIQQQRENRLSRSKTDLNPENG